MHTFRITDSGIQVFPRVEVGPHQMPLRLGGAGAKRTPPKRISIGVEALDKMLGGGIPAGYSVLLAGPSGSGKSVLATEFINAGARDGEAAVVAMFEKRPYQYEQIGQKFEQMVRHKRHKKVGIVQTRPLDLSLDETLHDVIEVIDRLKATRLVIDSLSGFELALAPTFREDFRESLYRMVDVLTTMGITILMTAELEDSYGDLRFSPHGTAFLSDAIVLQRYIELRGQLKRFMTVVKVRGSAHSKDMRSYEITDQGIVMGEMLGAYDGLLTGGAMMTRRSASGTVDRKGRRGRR